MGPARSHGCVAASPGSSWSCWPVRLFHRAGPALNTPDSRRASRSHGADWPGASRAVPGVAGSSSRTRFLVFKGGQLVPQFPGPWPGPDPVVQREAGRAPPPGGGGPLGGDTDHHGTAGQGREVGDARRGKAGPWCARPGRDGPRRLRVDGRASAAFSVQPAAGSWRMATANEPLSARFQRFVSYRTLSSVQHPACHCPPKDADTVADVEPPWDSNPVQSPLDQVDVAF